MRLSEFLSEDVQTTVSDPYDDIAAHALPQYRLTYGKPEHIAVLRQRYAELDRKYRSWRSDSEMSDDEKREMFDLERSLKAYDAAKPLHRIGSDHEFSEFTHDPSGQGHFPKMSGSRDTGFASGMYAFQTPRKNTVEVSPPRHPLVVNDLPEDEARMSSVPYVFNRAATSLMRMAEAWANYTPQPLDDWELDFARRFSTSAEGVDLEKGIRVKPQSYKLEGTPGWDFKRLANFFEHYAPPARKWRVHDDLLAAISTWEKHRQVHPLNILLSRWGFDGVVWGDNEKAREGDDGTYGAVKFPPIDADGKLIGLDPVDGKYMRMRGR